MVNDDLDDFVLQSREAGHLEGLCSLKFCSLLRGLPDILGVTVCFRGSIPHQRVVDLWYVAV